MVSRTVKQGGICLAAIVFASFTSGCGGDDSEETVSTTTVTEATGSGPDAAIGSDPSSDPILIQTQMRLPTGEVSDGSLLGESDFCRGGEVRDDHGSADTGAVVKTFECPDGNLEITFTPTQVSSVQSSPWEVIGGSGEFKGASGQGWMVARFGKGSRPAGQETFTGTIER